MSAIRRTRSVGASAGDDFLNAAAVLSTRNSPEELLQALHKTEDRFGRIRTQHWGPRILDLDLILHGDTISNVPQLVVPHAAMWYRRFVLDPAVEVAGELVHPILGASVTQLQERLLNHPLQLELCSEGAEDPPSLGLDIVDSIGHIDGKLHWTLVESNAEITSTTFARIVVRIEESPKVIQPLNLSGRRISVSGEDVADIVLQIRHLTRAMLG